MGSFGKYQLILLAINFVSFFLAGVYETAIFLFFDLRAPSCPGLTQAECMNLYCNTKNANLFPGGLPHTIPYQLHFECSKSTQYLYKIICNLSIIMGLLVAGHLSNKYGYKKVLIGSTALLLVGTCMLAIKNETTMYISLALISMPQYSTSCLFLCLMIEIIREKYAQYLVIIMFAAKLLGNMAIDGLYSITDRYQLLVFSTLIPLSMAFMCVHWFYH